MKIEARLVKRSLKMIVILFVVIYGTLYFLRSRLISEAKPLRISTDTTVLVEATPGDKLPYLKTYLGNLTDPVPPEDDASPSLKNLVPLSQSRGPLSGSMSTRNRPIPRSGRQKRIS